MNNNDNQESSDSIDYSNLKAEDIEDVLADFRDGEFDNDDEAINSFDYEHGSLKYRLAQFRLWVQPKPTWARILIWTGAITVAGILTALVIGLAVAALYVIAIIAIVVLFGWAASLSKK